MLSKGRKLSNQGKVVEEFGYPSLEVEKMLKLPVRPDNVINYYSAV